MRELNSIPKPRTLLTGFQHELTSIIDEFFFETKEYVQERYGCEDIDFEIKHAELAYFYEQVTDDCVAYLKCKHEILAAVFNIRTDFNDMHYTFFRCLENFENSYILNKSKK